MLELGKELGNLKMTISWFNHKIEHYRNNYVRNPFAEGHVNVRRLMVQHNKLIEAYRMLLETNRRENLGMIMHIEPHRFNGTTYETITFSTDYYF